MPRPKQGSHFALPPISDLPRFGYWILVQALAYAVCIWVTSAWSNPSSSRAVLLWSVAVVLAGGVAAYLTRPRTLAAKADFPVRLGRLLSWVGSCTAAVIAALGVSEISTRPANSFGLYVLIVAAIPWGLGRGLRYLIAGE